jgi:hypothetical protein
VRLSTSGPRAPKSPRPHHRSHQKLSPRVNLPSARLKRPRMTSLTQRSFASFCNGEPRACRGLPQLPGKTQPRAIIVCGRRPPSRRAQQQTPSRDPRTRRPLRRQRRPRRRWCVHTGLISVTRRVPRLNKWRRHPPPPARQPSSLAFLTSSAKRHPHCRRACQNVREPGPAGYHQQGRMLPKDSLCAKGGAKRRNQEPA